jgi:hypothetical protein
MTIHCQEFHELAMDYRGAHALHAQGAYEKLCGYVEGIVKDLQRQLDMYEAEEYARQHGEQE